MILKDYKRGMSLEKISAKYGLPTKSIIKLVYASIIK